MDKSTKREVQKATNFAGTDPYYAAATLAPLMRAAPNNMVLDELVQVMNDLNLRDYMDVVNGCYVAKAPV